jgi:glycosyltransferase involved in cell wall biosynthesis
MPETTRPPLSVVIATRNRAHLLNHCLERVMAGGLGDDEILVVDSASSKGDTVEVAAKHGARCVRLAVPGACRARNLGWRTARHDLIAFIDDDVLVHADWRDAIAHALDEPHNAFVTGWIGLPPEQAGAVDPQPHIVQRDRMRLDGDSQRYRGAGANIGVRRHALTAIGGFDERLGPATWFAAAEDADLFDRLVASGHLGEYRPDVRVDHDAWRSRRDRLRQRWSYGKGTGARIRLMATQDRARAWRSVRIVLWQRGLKVAIRRARKRWWEGAVFSVLQVAGAIAGFVVAYPQLRSSWPLDTS